MKEVARRPSEPYCKKVYINLIILCADRKCESELIDKDSLGKMMNREDQKLTSIVKLLLIT